MKWFRIILKLHFITAALALGFALTNQRTNLKNDILYLRWLTKKIYVCACSY
jgi:hypothetical protein